MNERDLDIAWLDAEVAFDEIVKQYSQTRRGEDGSRSGGRDDLQGADAAAAEESIAAEVGGEVGNVY
jgi:hypothetical protein